MNILRRILRLEDKQYLADASAVSEEIHAAQQEKQANARRIETRANQQTLSLRSSDRLLDTWQGAAAILRDKN